MKKILLKMIKMYQKYISRYTPRACIYYPTCSTYAYMAIEKYGIFKGTYLSIKRILRCNPFFKGGVDNLK